LPIQHKIANGIDQRAQEATEDDELIQAKTQTAQRQPNEPDAVQAACLMPRDLVAPAGSVLQAAWATVQGTLERLNLATLKEQLSPEAISST
jgi:hypothetical protein